MIEGEPFGDREHQASRSGNQSRQKRMEEFAWNLQFVGRLRLKRGVAGMDRFRLLLVFLLDIDLDENAVAGGVRKDLEGKLFGIEAVFFLL